jgi:hypothetical protein
MGFSLAIKGQNDTINLGVDVIQDVRVAINTPHDSMAKSSTVAASLLVTGKILTNELGFTNSDTVKLLEWALVPANNSDAYRNVTVQVVAAGEVVRTIPFPNAFIVDYDESFNNATGVGQFALYLRQKVDCFDKIKPTGGQQIGA